MRIICGKSALVEGINIASKAVSAKASMPILECCLLTAKRNDSGDGSFTLMANDMELAIETKPIEADILEEGSVALDSRMFFDIIRRLPGNAVEITSDDKNLTVIRSDKSEFKVLGHDGGEFPVIPDLGDDDEKFYTMPAAEFKNMIRQTIFSISTDISRPALCGELLDIDEDSVKMVSVDNTRLSLRKYDFDNAVGPAKVIIPGKTLNEISKILPADTDATISFRATDKHILFNLDSSVVVSRLLEGDFINYENMFANQPETKIAVDRAELLECIERASLISRDTKRSPIKLKFEDGQIIITCNTEMGTSYEEITVEQDGPGLEIGFNSKFITDVLKVLEHDRVVLELTSSLSPCIIKVEGSDEYKYFVLPRRLR